MKFCQFGAAEVFLSISILAAGLGIFIEWPRPPGETGTAAAAMVPFIGAAIGALLRKPIIGWFVGLTAMVIYVIVDSFLQMTLMAK
jgi:hypothetical protein